MIFLLTTKNRKLKSNRKWSNEQRRNTTDEFYKKSYQTSIHKLNAKIETRKHIINDFKEVIGD